MGAQPSREAPPGAPAPGRRLETVVLPAIDMEDLRRAAAGDGGKPRPRFPRQQRAPQRGGGSGDDTDSLGTDDPLPLEVIRFISTNSGVKWLVDVVKGARGRKAIGAPPAAGGGRLHAHMRLCACARVPACYVVCARVF
jgi:hypothetical protein